MAGAPGGVRVLAEKEVPAEAGLEHWRSQGNLRWGRDDVPICLLHLGLGAEPVQEGCGGLCCLVFPTRSGPQFRSFPWHSDTPHPHPAWTKRALDRPLLTPH